MFIHRSALEEALLRRRDPLFQGVMEDDFSRSGKQSIIGINYGKWSRSFACLELSHIWMGASWLFREADKARVVEVRREINLLTHGKTYVLPPA